jgi:hypothetical protein
VRVLLFILIYDLVMTAYYQYCRMGEKGGVNFGGSAWQVDRKTSEFQRWYPPRDLSVESIPNRKSKILKPPHLSVGSI